MTSVIPTCSNDSAAVEVVARSHDDIWSEDGNHRNLFVRIDYICVGNDGQQVRDNLQIWVVVRGIYSRCCLGTIEYISSTEQIPTPSFAQVPTQGQKEMLGEPPLAKALYCECLVPAVCVHMVPQVFSGELGNFSLLH